MRAEVYEWIRSNPDIHHYLRIHPVWYRRLARNPETLERMVKESDLYYGKTLPQRVEKLQRNMQLAMMMVEMMKQVKQT